MERWIADLEKLELSERQPDNTYRVAYKMQPIEQYESDVRIGRDVLQRAKDSVDRER